MSNLRVQATITADGRQAAVELAALKSKVAEAGIALDEAKDAARRAGSEFKKLNRDTAEGADEAAKARDRLRDLKLAELEAAEAAAAARRAYDAQRASLAQVGTVSGQVRASMVNLGQQVGDISQGFALGVSPLTIFAQQAGQVGFALSGLNGVLGKVGGFLAGPYGAALTGATLILGGLWAAHSKASESAEKQETAENSLKKALEELDQITGRTVKTTEEKIRADVQAARVTLEKANATRVALQAELELQKAQERGNLARAENPAFASEFGNMAALAAGQSAGRVAELQAALKANAAEIATTQAQLRSATYAAIVATVEQATNKAAVAAREYEAAKIRLQRAVEAGTISEAEAERQLKAKRAAMEAAQETERRAKDVTREHNSALKEQEQLLAGIMRGYQGALSAMEAYSGRVMAGLAAQNDAARDPFANRPKDSLSSLVDAADARLASRLDERAGKWGTTAGRAFNDQALSQAVAVGQAIGGTAGGLIRTVAGTIQGARTGNFTGIGTPLGGALTLLSPLAKPSTGSEGPFLDAFRKEFRSLRTGFSDSIDRLGSTFGKIFKIDGAFGQTLGQLAGQAAGGAAVGAGVAEVGGLLGIKLNSRGAAAGGAVGNVLGNVIGGPIGGAIGSVLGSIAGGLIKGKNPYADARLSTDQTGVTSSVYATRGDGSAGTGNSIAGAVRDQLGQIASALGADIVAGRQLGSIGFSGKDYYFNPTGGDFKGAGAQTFGSAEDAVAAAVGNALATGTISASPRVQAALVRYAGNVNTAVAEALKVKGLEDLLASRDNPFTATFQALERQLKQRVDVARAYGFDLVQIEKINAEDRAKALKDAIGSATGSIKSLLADLTSGSRATGSISERLAALGQQRDTLAAAARAGDTSGLDNLAQVLQQIDDLQRQAYGATGAFASGRADTVGLLNELIAQTEARAKAAADAAQKATQAQTASLASIDATAEDLFKQGQETNNWLAQIAAALSAGGSLNTINLADFARS